MTLDETLELLRQPKGARRGPAILRELGTHPQGEAPVNLMSGRYGPYVTDGTVNASLPRGADPDAVTMEQAVALLAERAARGPTKRAPAKRAAKKTGKPAAKTKTAKGGKSGTRKRAAPRRAGGSST